MWNKLNCEEIDMTKVIQYCSHYYLHSLTDISNIAWPVVDYSGLVPVLVRESVLPISSKSHFSSDVECAN